MQNTTTPETNDNESKKALIIKADHTLQRKIGLGPLDQKAVARAQRVMDNNSVDFQPLAQEYLNHLADAIGIAKFTDISRNEAVGLMTTPVMQLKANAATFRYTLIGTLANIMLSFLEGIREIDEDVIDIVSAHHKTLSAIVAKKMEGDGGAYGRQLEDELKLACKRYFTKQNEA
jgi:hypothetical protein